jgi:predicted lipoprotein with Yx(FWY)xxD motif
MNQPNTSNTSDDQSDNYSSQKSARRANLRVLMVAIALVLVTALVFTLFLMNRSSDRSPTVSTDMRSTNSNQPSPETAHSNPGEPAATGTVITTSESEFGTMLFNEKKQAIYIWELEDSAAAECYGDCAEAWPPVLTDGNPQATGEVNSDLLGTTKRSDGSTQVTYNGHPLYHYAHEGAGEVKCHNVATHGGLWWVIRPDGNRAD